MIKNLTHCDVDDNSNSLQLMEAISGMVEEMFEETKQKYKSEADKAVELVTMAAELEKETFKLDFKRDVCFKCGLLPAFFIRVTRDQTFLNKLNVYS